MSQQLSMKLESQKSYKATDANQDESMSLELIASQFMDEYRRWLNPSVDDYAVAYPEYADEIHESFPVLIAMEQWKGNHEYSSLQNNFPEEFSISKLGNCHIIREIRRNKTSILYEAVQGMQNRRVAVKLLPWKSELIPRWRERFEREARLITRLRHQNIISIYSTGEDQGYCFSVMQLVAGVGLDQIIKNLAEFGGVNLEEIVQRDFNWKQEEEGKNIPGAATQNAEQDLLPNAWHAFAGIGLQVAKGLQYAHQQGTLHNDIKPENILIDGVGSNWITDFSLVQFPEGTLRQQGVDSLLYKAPERFQGQNNEQSDLYSLGMVLYELVTLTRGFQSCDKNQLIENITKVGPVRPRELNPNIPVALEMIILNCIARSPADRYQSANELSLDLVRFIKGAGVESRRKSGRKSDQRWFSFFKKRPK